MIALGPFLFFLILAVALIVSEILIFNLSVFWFLFVGLGALITAVVSWLVPEITWLFAILTFVISTSIISAALYKPLKRFQTKKGPMAGNDAVGQTVTAVSDVENKKAGTVDWSGAQWTARLASGSEVVKEGELAKIKRVEGIVLYVSAIEVSTTE